MSGLVRGAEPLVLWHRFNPDESLVLDRLLQEVAVRRSIRIRAEFVEDPAIALIKARAVGRLPAAVIGPGDLVGLSRTLNYSAIPPGMLPARADPRIAWQKSAGPARAIPLLRGNHLMLFYNKALIHPLPATFAALRKKRPQPGRWLLTWDYREPYYLWPFFAAFGAAIISESGEPELGTSFVEALRFYRTLLEDGLLKPDCDHQCAKRTFYDGQALVLMGGDWDFKEAWKHLGTDLGVAPLFKVNGHSLRPLTTGRALFFPDDALNGRRGHDLKAVVKALLSPRGQRLLAAAGMLPVTAGITVRGMPADLVQASLLQLEQAVPLRHPEKMTVMWHVLHKGMGIAFRGRVPLPELAGRLETLARNGFAGEARNENP